MYGQPPPTSLSYIPGTTKVQVMDDLLHSRNDILSLLRRNLAVAHDCVKSQADQHHWEVVFKVGKKAHTVPNLSPDKVSELDLHEGEWGDHGSVKVLTYVAGKKAHTVPYLSPDKVSKLELYEAHLTAVEGHCLDLFKSYNII
ncbi:hypothetical protein CsSME_00022585 [Camellia sinensis var. sinensis]